MNITHQFKTKPWAHQLTAMHFFIDKPSIMIAYDMGTGKSKIAIDLINHRGHNKILIVCPKPVIDVWPGQFEEHSLKKFHVLELEKGTTKQRAAKALTALREPRPTAIVLNYEAVWRDDFANVILRAAKGDVLNCVIVDECVSPGTRISTPNGDIEIEKLNIGESIYGFDHKTNRIIETKISHTFKGRNDLDRVVINDTVMTRNHPVWTKEKGYISASSILGLDTVACIGLKSNEKSEATNGLFNNMRVVQRRISSRKTKIKGQASSFLWKKLFCEMENVKTGICKIFGYGKKKKSVQKNYEAIPKRSKDSEKIKCLSKFKSQPIQEPKNSKENSSKGNISIKGVGIQKSQWRQWDIYPIAAEIISDKVGMACGICYKNEIKIKEISKPLQNRYSAPKSENRNRSRWIQPSIKIQNQAGSKERPILNFKRLESSQIQKQRNTQQYRASNGSNYENNVVHNIETETGNYFANGLLVHNSHRIKSPGGKTSLFFRRLGALVKSKMCLTGTPMPHSPLDVWAQYRFLDPSIYGTSFHWFKTKYAILGGFNNKQVMGFRDMEDLNRKFYSIAYRVKADDVLDLPPEIHETRTVELSSKENNLYCELEQTLMAEIDEGIVTASNGLVKLLRLQQITSGFCVTEEDKKALIGESKKKVLQDFMQDLNSKEPIVVFCRFHRDLDSIREASEKNQRPCFELSGRRNDLPFWKKSATNGAVLAVQIQSGSLGIDLTMARYAVYYSTGFSLGDYEQSLRRLRRPGQEKTVTYIHLIAPGTVDEKVFYALKNRKHVVESVLKRLKEESYGQKTTS